MKTELAFYLMQVLTIHGIFYFVYYFFLRKAGNHSLTRSYLLITLVLAFALPNVTIPLQSNPVSVIEKKEVVTWLEIRAQAYDLVAEGGPQQKKVFRFSAWDLLVWSYLGITLYLVGRSLLRLVHLQKVKKRSEYVDRKWYRLFKTSQDQPFSFLRNVFIPARLFETNAFEPILEHECAHVKQRHSFDRLLVDLAVALLWFNPFLYLYRRSLIEIHEYQADEAVVERFQDPIGYQEILFSQLKRTPHPGLVSHFNFSMIKKRIVMINRQNKKQTWLYVFTIPIILVVTLAFAGKTTQQLDYFEEKFSSEVGTVEEVVTAPVQDDFTPSILPVKEPKEMRLTSAFGIAKDPISKEDRMHKGLDLRVPLETTVISTAKGVVHQSAYHKRYGNFVLIDHGDTYMTRYAHLSSFSVKRGDQVIKGQEIGLSGNSGRSTGPHLHYEVIEVSTGHRDPLDYITDYQFNERP